MLPIRKTVLLVCVLAAALCAQSNFYLRDGDRVVFYGDSITDQRLYTTFTETYVLTRFPRLKVSFTHSGWGGDRVSGGGGGPVGTRLERDVFAYKPAVLTIMLGMNDGRYRAFDPQIFNDFAQGYGQIIDKVKSTLPDARITVIQPSPYDDVTRAPLFEGGYNSVLVRYSEFLKDLARQQNLTVADLNTPVVAALRKANAADPGLAAKIVPDRVHPGPGGHLLMAAALLKAWNAPGVVAAVEIDTATGRVLREENTSVSNLDRKPNLAWTQEDAALPMPFDARDATLMLAVRSSDFLESLNSQPLKIHGLGEGRYTLRIDGEPVGSFTGAQLEDGINLAALPTPMARQAAEVHALTLKHNNVHNARWRQVQVPLAKEAPEHLPQAMAALDALEADLVQMQRAAAQPQKRRYELAPE